MKDTIYREDVTELIKKSRNSTDWDEADAGAFFHWTAKLNRDIDKLPSAEKTGKWIWENYVWHCDQCGKNPTYGMEYVQRKEELFDFCPHCGVGMVKE